MQTKIHEEMREALIAGDRDKIIEKVDEWKKECVHIGIAGSSMVGKTSFINAMLGEAWKDEAKIGPSTIQATLVYNPKYKGVKFLDYPGYGTPYLPLNEEYFKAQPFEYCDLVLVFYSSVLQETDIIFINHLVTLEKKFVLVRTRADDLKHVANMKHEPFDRLADNVKRRCLQKLKEQGLSEDVKVFIISNSTPSFGEFDDLLYFLTKHTNETKRMHILMILNRQTRELIDEKEKQLLNRAREAALSTWMFAFIPIPGIEIPFNMRVLTKEIKSYLDEFHLDEKSLELHPATHVKKLKTCPNVTSDEFIKENIRKFTINHVKNVAIEIAVPGIGRLINGPDSASCMYDFLKQLIADLAEDARILMQLQNECLV